MQRFVFIDTETTGLREEYPVRREIVEVAAIVRDEGGECSYIWQPKADLATADPKALELNGYYERIAPRLRLVPPHDPERFVETFYRITDGATIVGANVEFDLEFVHATAARYGLRRGRWHHRKLDIESMAYPLVSEQGEKPVGLSGLADHFGVELDRDDDHGALRDVRATRDIFDAIMQKDS